MKKSNVFPPNMPAHNAHQSYGAFSNHIPENLLEQIDYLPVKDIAEFGDNPRKHSRSQIKKLSNSIREFGFIIPILVNDQNQVIVGYARVLAALEANLTSIPVIRVSHLTHPQHRALRIADNKLAESSEWDERILALEFNYLLEVNYDLDVTGFEAAEIDFTIGEQLETAPPEEDIPDIAVDTEPVAKLGDLWILGKHRLYCGNALAPQDYKILMDNKLANLVITDPPYNVPIKGNVGGLGSIQHDEFIMASGEMSEEEFEAFLCDVTENLSENNCNGSVHCIFMDWRHQLPLLNACNHVYDAQLNLCVWAKTNGGMGSLYRSQHELAFIFKKGTAPHINNIQLGKYGRNRTNVWTYEGANTPSKISRESLSLHPTSKPVKMIADAILDCSNRNHIILDPFIGSGTAIIACEQTGRRCFGMELDPRYVDVAIKRWENFTGEEAVLANTNQTNFWHKKLSSNDVLYLPSPDQCPQNGGQIDE